MENKVKNIVCKNISSVLVATFESEIEDSLNNGWSLECIQDSIITALQNVNVRKK